MTAVESLSSPAMELPECPVCLEPYDEHVAIPRVLSCGHSVCEACIVELPQKYSNTVRCPVCMQLVKYSSQQGPSSLPKNIDLLRICLQHSTPSTSSDCSRKKPNQRSAIDGGDVRAGFSTRFWSDEFYIKWKDWILLHDAVSVGLQSKHETCGFGYVLRGRFSSGSSLKDRVSVSLRDSNELIVVPVFQLPHEVNRSEFRFGKVAWIMECLEGMGEVMRQELTLILETSMRQSRVCRVYGLWSDVDGPLCLACEKQSCSFLEEFNEMRNGFLGLELEDKCVGVFSFAMVGKGVSESVLALHLEGMVAGCLGLSCFFYDELGSVCVDLSEVLMMGRKIMYAVDNYKEEALFDDCLKNELFISPEVLLKLLQKKGDINPESGNSRYPHPIGYGSDVWSLACVLLQLLIGDALPQCTLELNEENGLDLAASYGCWVEKVSSFLEDKLGSEYIPLRQTICKCLDMNPGNRPSVVDVRNCIQGMLVKHQLKVLGNLEVTINRNTVDHCLILGELCQREHKLPDREGNGQPSFVQDGEGKSNEDFGASPSKGIFEFEDLRGHRDCITGLVVGGGYLLSSSFDKTVNVWSLQDFSHLHTFRGHEDKVMALAYVDDKEPLCISCDSGGGIFVWGITVPLRQDPLRKWYEQKDWRFSGIHSLAVSINHCLYTGSGDRTIKGWSLKDGSLICTMNGHRSVVSTLAICDEVLYSGSWDGTVRLWSLNDHSPLTVLGEDVPAEMKSIMAITVDRHLLVAAYENGCIKVWRNDVFMGSKSLHNGSIFAMSMQGKCLYTGGWDKNVNIQELSGDEFELDVRAFGSIPCSSVVTTILCCQGKLFVGYADKSIKVYRRG